MLEAKRLRKCSDLVLYNSEEEARKEPGRLQLSWETTKEYTPVKCPNCDRWHLLHQSYVLEDFE